MTRKLTCQPPYHSMSCNTYKFAHTALAFICLPCGHAGRNGPRGATWNLRSSSIHPHRKFGIGKVGPRCSVSDRHGFAYTRSNNVMYRWTLRAMRWNTEDLDKKKNLKFKDWFGGNRVKRITLVSLLSPSADPILHWEYNLTYYTTIVVEFTLHDRF